MANAYKNKVVYNGNTLIDISDTTATASDVNAGKNIYLASGQKVTGTQVVYGVLTSLSHISASNVANKVIGNGTFYSELAPEEGFSITSVTVTMNGNDITDSVFTGYDGTVEGYSLTSSLTHCFFTDVETTKSSFYAVLNAESGYESPQVIITVGGVDMSNYYSSGVINIPNVTGNIVITAVAAQAVVSSITAVFTQGSAVIYDNQTLDDLKQYLMVTAHYENGTSGAVTGYTLSGTLAEGTSTITVSYAGKSATFNVTVTHATVYYTITNSLTDVTNSNSATSIAELTAYSGTLTATSGYIMGTVTVSMGNTDITATAYNSETGAISIASVTGNVTITAVAVEDVGWISGVAYDSDTINISEGGYRISTSTGEVYEYDSGSNRVTDFIPCRGVSAIVLSSGRLLQYVFYYDENKVFISAPQGNTGIENPCPVPAPRNAAYFRMCANTTEPTIIPYLYDTLPGNTQYELGKHYVFDWTEAHDTKYSPYVLCLLATELKVGTTSRIFTYFYDYEGTQISGDAHTGTSLITVPEGAKTMRLWFSTTSGILDNDWFMFTS